MQLEELFAKRAYVMVEWSEDGTTVATAVPLEDLFQAFKQRLEKEQEQREEV
jgi:hypothetical protein